MSLQQGRYTWRHNNVLQHITSTIKYFTTKSTEVFADLEGFQVSGPAIPADVLISSGKGSKPDLVLIDRSRKKIAMMELTCSLPCNEASSRKNTVYTQLEMSLQEKGYIAHLVPFEVCSNGFISRRKK